MAVEPLRIAVIGAGDVGTRHLEVLESDPGFTVVGITDPARAATEYAGARKIAYYKTEYERMLDDVHPDGALVATPTPLHLEMALACIARKIPVLVEKPICDSVDNALTLARESARANIPVLVGHHRRYNPAFDTAVEFIRAGNLGKITAVTGTWLRRKPDSYFEMKWRREPGGGPLLINAIHDFDCLRVLCGEIDTVHAVTSNMARGFAVEDTAAILFQFTNGALGTFIISDAVQAPWCWETTAWENASWYPQQPVDCYVIGGSDGSLTVPSLEFWWNEKGGGRNDPMNRRRLQSIPGNPHILQWRHFARVIRGEEKPLVDAIEATRTLAVTLAVTESANAGRPVKVQPIT